MEPGEYRGNSWTVKPQGNKYILSYVSGSLQGELLTIEITKEEYEAAKDNEFDYESICRKYSIS